MSETQVSRESLSEMDKYLDFRRLAAQLNFCSSIIKRELAADA
jgi:hypothetical protein